MICTMFLHKLMDIEKLRSQGVSRMLTFRGYLIVKVPCCCAGRMPAESSQIIRATAFQVFRAGLRSGVLLFKLFGGQPRGKAHFVLDVFVVGQPWRETVKEDYQY